MKRVARFEIVLALASGVLAALGGFTACSSSSSGGETTSDAGASGDSAADAASDGSTSVDGGSDTGQQQLPVTCENYCNVISTACTGTNAEYLTTATCLAMCANMTLGTQGDMTGDTVACRQSFAEIAAANPGTNCPSAGPTGGDVCGPNRCVSWCELDRDLCGTIAYPDEATCESACEAFPYNDNGETVELTGDTLNCRIYHIEAAYGSPDGSVLQMTHCAHTAQMSRVLDGGPGPCIGPAP
jgi:hypothetical protein